MLNSGLDGGAPRGRRLRRSTRSAQPDFSVVWDMPASATGADKHPSA